MPLQLPAVFSVEEHGSPVPPPHEYQQQQHSSSNSSSCSITITNAITIDMAINAPLNSVPQFNALAAYLALRPALNVFRKSPVRSVHKRQFPCRLWLGAHFRQWHSRTVGGRSAVLPYAVQHFLFAHFSVLLLLLLLLMPWNLLFVILLLFAFNADCCRWLLLFHLIF